MPQAKEKRRYGPWLPQDDLQEQLGLTDDMLEERLEAETVQLKPAPGGRPGDMLARTKPKK
jgi:hypothetical protein